jgi:hypothetical protein
MEVLFMVNVAKQAGGSSQFHLQKNIQWQKV